MFPDSKTAKSFSMARTKSMYAINHGLSPYFKSLLDESLATRNLDQSHLFQVSMDGPNVNLKFFREFSTEFRENNIGSCSLHILHGSFTRGAEKTEWNLKKLMKGGLLSVTQQSCSSRGL